MEYSVLSRIGTRELNEDFAKAAEFPSGFCCVLADGLGGHDRGEAASKLVTMNSLALFEKMCPRGSASLLAYVDQCFADGQKKLTQCQKKENSDMKTTMVVLASDGEYLQWGHIGDSRLYYFKNGKLVLRTLDHSVPQMLVRTGEIREDEIRGHEDRNRLLRVMGSQWDTPKHEMAEPVKLEGGQALLLCSDGFWEWIDEKQMIRALGRSETPGQWISLMEEVILKNAGGKEMDNYSAIAVFAGEKSIRKKRFGFFKA